MMPSQIALAAVAALAGLPWSVSAQALASPPGASTEKTAMLSDSVTVRFQNLELRAAVQVLGQYLDRPVLFSGQGGQPVSLEAPRPVARRDILALIRSLLESQNFELVSDSTNTLYKARPRVNAPPPSGPPFAASANGTRLSVGIELFVVQLRHARATDVATTINALYGREALGGGGGFGGGRSITLGDALRETRIPSVADPYAAPPVAATGSGLTSIGLTGPLTIVADARANSLLVRSNAADFELIRRVVSQLDVRPLQVLIEVLIAEVRRERSLGISTEGELGTTAVGKNGASITGNSGGPGLGDFALNVMKLGGLDLDATLRLASQKGDVRIVSRPVVIAANNQEAVIVVGSQRPFVQLQRSLPTDALARDQVVQYRDVGTKLSVKPTISVDGLVQLEVTQEVSNATSETQFNAPVIATRSIQTQLLVRDGQTVALGGLTDRQKDVSRGGIPILSSIPLIGGFFGHARRSTAETELFIFLTPRVIRTDEDAIRVTEPLKKRAGATPQ